MWSKNGMPVLMDALPRPSMFSLRLMRVSLVTRLIAACRDFMRGIKQKRTMIESSKNQASKLQVNLKHPNPNSRIGRFWILEIGAFLELGRLELLSSARD